jgi:hypothetical protein
MEFFKNFCREDVMKAYSQFSLRLEEAVAAECDFIH